ncbi:MAG: FAD-dependent oxidoreductase [Alphaproteobacteria bacterium]|nr:FAD-dependent oxidoreductase [Alphaproteobacteria bacterium]
MSGFPTHTRVLVIGGGVVGCSVAYHLAHLGWSDVVLAERKQLTCGTTWHAAGLIAQLRATMNMTRLAKYSQELYGGLEAETGIATGFKRNGSLAVALSDERMEEFLRNASMAKTHGVEVNVVTAKDCHDMHPYLNIDGVVGGLHIPLDGQGDPANIAMALARGARQKGAKIFENTKVEAIHTKDGRVTGARTDKGDIEAEIVINCAGMWAHQVGRMAGVNVPLHACEHFYILTEGVDGLPGNLPVLRVPDECAYYKEDAGKILLGAFEPVSKPWGMDGISDEFCFDELPEDFDHFQPVLEKAIERLPLLESAGIHTFFNGPESFTPDDRYLLGPAPELENFYVAAGFNSVGIQSAGGAGKALAEWIVEGEPPFDLWDVDVRRMEPFQGNRTYLKNRVTETLGLLYADHFPYRQYETARNIRQTPFHEKMAERGACFGETAGWERPNWFVPAEALARGTKPIYDYSWKRQNWFEYAAEEHRAVRNQAGLFDLSAFGKFRVEGPDAMDVLQRLCGNDVDVAPGKIVYTQWLNSRGCIEADVTVTRLSADSYIVITGAATVTRDFSWLQRYIPRDARCVALNVTSGEGVLGLMGPNSRTILQKATPADLSNEAFPFATSQTIELGMALVRAHRITYVGELGWELYVPAEMSRHVFDVIYEAGQADGLRLAGMHVLDSCRMEKGFRHFGHDISDEDHVLEAGLGFAVKTGKPEGRFGPFVGQDAVIAQKEKGVGRRLLQFLLDDPDPLLFHTEPIIRDGEVVGYLTSGNYGHVLGASVGLGYVPVRQGESLAEMLASNYEIEVAGQRVSAKASLKPLYDPQSEKIRM